MLRKNISHQMSSLFLFFIIVSTVLSLHAADAPLIDHDPHYTKVGFFDVHICNWPDRPLFFKILFSSEKFNEIAEMQVLYPSGSPFVRLNKTKFKKLIRKGKPEKRVYMVNVDVPDSATAGWYSIKVRTTDGAEYSAKDLVPMIRINRVTGLDPSSEEGSFPLPVTLTWKQVTGAGYYKVFIRDVWTGDIIYKSKLIAGNKISIPEGKLMPGGYYSWAVHARDTNGHILLGDFHMGSMSEKAFFNVAE